jgi:hypothetical protein
MTIRLVHADKVFIGMVFYNFHQLKNTILIRLNYPLNNSTELMVLYDYEHRQWKEANELHNILPEVFDQLKFRLHNILEIAIKESLY